MPFQNFKNEQNRSKQAAKRQQKGLGLFQKRIIPKKKAKKVRFKIHLINLIKSHNNDSIEENKYLNNFIDHIFQIKTIF